MEVFKPIEGYPGYEVGDKGTVVSLNYRQTGKRHVLRGARNKIYGYRFVNLCRKGEKPKSKWVHKLVADAFLGPRPPGLVINHIDSNPANNRADNLEYITQKANVNTQHARAAQSKAKDDVKRPVVVLDGNGEPFCIFESATKAARMLNLSPGNIRHVCNGRYKHTGGYKFAWWNGER